MKRSNFMSGLIFLAFVLLLISVGCEDNSAGSPPYETVTLEHYYPLSQGMKWNYEEFSDSTLHRYYSSEVIEQLAYEGKSCWKYNHKELDSDSILIREYTNYQYVENDSLYMNSGSEWYVNRIVSGWFSREVGDSIQYWIGNNLISINVKLESFSSSCSVNSEIYNSCLDISLVALNSDSRDQRFAEYFYAYEIGRVFTRLRVETSFRDTTITEYLEKKLTSFNR
jgi:hypothetical protein